MRLEICLGTLGKKAKSFSSGSQILRLKWSPTLGTGPQIPQKIASTFLQDMHLCLVRAFKLYLKKHPPAPGNRYPVWGAYNTEIDITRQAIYSQTKTLIG